MAGSRWTRADSTARIIRRTGALREGCLKNVLAVRAIVLVSSQDDDHPHASAHAVFGLPTLVPSASPVRLSCARYQPDRLRSAWPNGTLRMIML